MWVKGLFLYMAIFLITYTHQLESIMQNNLNLKENNLDVSSYCKEQKDVINEMKTIIKSIYDNFWSNQILVWNQTNPTCDGNDKQLFKKKRLILDEMTRRNVLKFVIFYIHKNPNLLFPFHFFLSLFFPSINALVNVNIVQGIY